MNSYPTRIPVRLAGESGARYDAGPLTFGVPMHATLDKGGYVAEAAIPWAARERNPKEQGDIMLKHPVSIYMNWAAYDELADTIELTEALPLRQLDELPPARLRHAL